MKQIRLIILVKSILVFLGFAHVIKADEQEECYMQPGNKNGVCIVFIESDIAMTVHYKKYKVVGGKKSLVEEKQYEVARPAGIIYSDNGVYLAEIYTEEGHPHFVFYQSNNYFSGDEIKSVGFLEDYYMDSIEEFSDKGVLIYRTWKDDCDEKGKEGCIVMFKLGEESK